MGASATATERRTPEVAIVGAGMSGICIGARLKRAGIDRITLYEKEDALGGTWRDNTYPGVSSDVPARFFQFSFAPNPAWSHVFAGGAEILRYLTDVAAREGVLRHVELGCEIVEARFDDGRWRLRTADGGQREADFLIAASGFLRHPHVPAFEGLGEFAGELFHSARWPRDLDLRGRRVGVVGNGSTGVQIVSALAGTAGRVVSLQRTPQWILPLPNPRYSRATRSAHRRVPVLDRAGYRIARAAFEGFVRPLTTPGRQRAAMGLACRAYLRTVRDPELRRRLTPDHEPMCKRLVVSHDFYRAIQRDDVELVTESIERFAPGGVVTADGAVHELDAVVLATGFDSHAYVRPMSVVGEGGVTLAETWSGGNRAYRSVGVPGFPNLFLMLGPHSPVANYAAPAIAEAQAEFALRWIELWRAGRYERASPRAAATDRFNAELRAAMGDTVWVTGCDSWYLDDDGTPEAWPWQPGRYRSLLGEFALHDMEVETT